MVVNIVHVGRYRTVPDAEMAAFSGGNLRGNIYVGPSVNCWGYRFGGRFGHAGGSTPAVRMAAYLVSGGVPGDRRAYSAQINASTAMPTASGGAFYEADVSATEDEATEAAFRMWAGQPIAIGTLATGASLNHGFASAGSFDAPNKNLYSRAGLSQLPDPFGHTSSSYEGHLTLWIYAHTNEAPVAPNFRTPGSSDPNNPSVITTTTPDLAGTHRDRNGVWGVGNSGYDDGDKISGYRIEVRRHSDNAVMWSPSKFTASPEERSAESGQGRFSVTYAGTSLSRGTVYGWRCCTFDDFGEQGTWSDWLYFMPSSLGQVTLAGAPTGKIETNQPDFAFTWSHQTPLSTNAAQLRLYQGSNPSPVFTSGTISKTVANNASGTLTWADVGASNLLWGQAYSYSVRGRDTNNVWSNWSDKRSFATNAPPSIPDGLSPANGEIVTSRPLLTFLLTDPDDTVWTGLVGKVRVKDDTGSVISTEDATYNAVTGFWEYQTDSGDLASHDTYRWDAYGYDGTLYSGARTVENSAIKSGEGTFVYADGPTVAIDEPEDTDTIDSSTPTVEWTASAQNRYRLRVYLAGTNEIVYQRGPTVSGATSWQIPAGYLRNDTSYEIEVWVEDNSLLEGVSQRVAVDTDFTPPPAAEGVTATPIPIGNDPTPTAILVQWEATAEPPETYAGTYLSRDDVIGRPYQIITSAAVTSFIDYLPTSGVEYVYTVRHVGQRDLDLVESDAVTASAQVNLPGVVICAVENPELRAVLDSVQERRHERQRDEMTFNVGSRAEPTTFRSPTMFWRVSGEYRILPRPDLDDAPASIRQRLADLLALESADPVMYYRDERGRGLFVRFESFDFDEFKLYPHVRASFRQEFSELGVRP